MAVSLFRHEVSCLCIGKPPLRSLSISATVAAALSALKKSGENFLSVWSCDHSSRAKTAIEVEECRCIGKVCMVDIVCFLCKEENLARPAAALQFPVSALLPKVAGIVKHLDPHSSLLEAMNLILEGAQNLVIPIETRIGGGNSRKKFFQKASPSSSLHNNQEYCWLTQEDILRYLLNSIGLFCPTAIRSIDALNIIDTNNILAIHYDDPALLAVPLLSESLLNQTSVAIVDPEGILIGEISPFTINSCDETVVAAMATLSAGDLMAYIDCGGPPENLVLAVKEKLEERNLEALLELIMQEESGILSSSSSDEETGIGKSGRIGGYSARMVRRSEAIVCYPASSLVAVMIQALAHRVSYVWVVEDDGTLVGMVKFTSMLKVFRDYCKTGGNFI